MGQPPYMRSIVDQNVVMLRMPITEAIGWMVLGNNFQHEKESLLFSKMSRLALQPTQPPFPHVWGSFPKE